MPPTTPYASKIGSSYANNTNNNSGRVPQPHSPYRHGPAPCSGSTPTTGPAPYGAFCYVHNPYDAQQPHGSQRSCSLSSAPATRERHYSANENPYSPPPVPPPLSPPPPPPPRHHSTSCPGRVHRHSSSGSSGVSSGGEQPSRSNSTKGRFYGHAPPAPVAPAAIASYGEMCYHDNSLVSASLEALIQHLVPTVDYYPDVSGGEASCSFMSSFIHSFILI